MFKYLALIMVLFISGCSSESTIVSHNLSKAADNFQIDRRVIFYNGITGEYMLVIIGKCNVSNNGSRLEVVCKVGPNAYKKHFLGLSDNVTYFVEQLYTKSANAYHYQVDFAPQSILPDINFRGDAESLGNAVTPDTKD